MMTFPERAPMATDMQLVLHHTNQLFTYVCYMYSQTWHLKELLNKEQIGFNRPRNDREFRNFIVHLKNVIFLSRGISHNLIQ